MPGLNFTKELRIPLAYETRRADSENWFACTQADVRRACGSTGLNKAKKGDTVVSSWANEYRRIKRDS